MENIDTSHNNKQTWRLHNDWKGLKRLQNSEIPFWSYRKRPVHSPRKSVGDQIRSRMKHGTELFSVAEMSDAVTGDMTFPLWVLLWLSVTGRRNWKLHYCLSSETEAESFDVANFLDKAHDKWSLTGSVPTILWSWGAPSFTVPSDGFYKVELINSCGCCFWYDLIHLEILFTSVNNHFMPLDILSISGCHLCKQNI